LVCAGKTGTGFTQKTHRLMRDRLDKLRSAKTPFAKLPKGTGRDAIWVKPELVAQVSFSNWTADDLVRQAAFKGLREDKPAKSVVREEAQSEKDLSTKDMSHEDLKPDHSSKVARAEKRVRATSAAKTAKAATAESGVPAERPKSSDAADLPVPLTHPDKVIDEASGTTKQQLARYYAETASSMLPYIADRPVTLVRCVDGSGKPCFYQKHKNQMLSSAFGSVDVINRKTGVREPYITVSTREAIVQLAQIGVLEVHPW